MEKIATQSHGNS